MRRELPEKPYELVPFSPEAPDRQGPIGGHDRVTVVPDRLSGWLELELVTLRPVQVASGLTDFVTTGPGQERLALREVSVPKQDPRDPTRQKRTVLLPGSSLKGAVRSLVEALSASCIPVVNPRVRPFLPRRLGRCTDPKQLCPACRLFGAQDYQGQVGFADAEVPQGSLQFLGTPLLWAPARSRGRELPQRYLQGREAVGRKFYQHGQIAQGPDPRVVVKPNVTMPVRVFVENLSPGELGLLLAALGQHPQHPFPLKVGAGKPVGMGSIEVRLKAVVLLADRAGLERGGRLGRASRRLEGASLSRQVQAWVQAAEQARLLSADRLAAVALVLNRANLNRPSPSGPY